MHLPSRGMGLSTSVCAVLLDPIFKLWLIIKQGIGVICVSEQPIPSFSPSFTYIFSVTSQFRESSSFCFVCLHTAIIKYSCQFTFFYTPDPHVPSLYNPSCLYLFVQSRSQLKSSVWPQPITVSPSYESMSLHLWKTNGHCNGYSIVGTASVCRHATSLKAIKVSVSLSATRIDDVEMNRQKSRGRRTGNMSLQQVVYSAHFFIFGEYFGWFWCLLIYPTNSRQRITSFLLCVCQMFKKTIT